MTEKKRIKVLAADIGGVIAYFKHNAPVGTLKDFADQLWYHTKLEPDIWQPHLEIALGTPEYDFLAGRISPKEFYWKLRKIANVHCHGKAPFPTYQLFKKIWCNIFMPNVELLHDLRNLSKVYKVVLASNIDVWHRDLLWDMCGFDYFVSKDKSVISCEEHVLKPDPNFFHLLIKKCAIDPGEIFFFDDRPENCKSAFNCGIEVFQFVDNQSWKKEIEKQMGVYLINGC